MIMMAPPLQAAIEEAKQTSSSPAKVIYLSPQGQPLTQKKAVELAKSPISYCFADDTKELTNACCKAA